MFTHKTLLITGGVTQKSITHVCIIKKQLLSLYEK